MLASQTPGEPSSNSCRHKPLHGFITTRCCRHVLDEGAHRLKSTIYDEQQYGSGGGLHASRPLSRDKEASYQQRIIDLENQVLLISRSGGLKAGEVWIVWCGPARSVQQMLTCNASVTAHL